MKFKELFKKFISRGAVIYTVGSLIVLLFSLAASESLSAKILSPMPFLFFAAYSYVMALGSALYSSGAFSGALSRLIHALCYNVGFFGFMLLCQITFTYAAIFTAIYAIIYIAAVVIARVLRKKPSENAKERAKQHKQKPVTIEGNKKEKNKPQSTYTNRFS